MAEIAPPSEQLAVRLAENFSGGTVMNKWVLAAILVAAAIFMYVSIIYKMA